MGARNKLIAKQIEAAGVGKMYDGAGLILDRGVIGGKWLFRYTFAGRRREMGLGTWPEIRLAQARALRDEWAFCLSGGRDPIAERIRRNDDARAADKDRDPTLEELVADCFEARRDTLRGGGERGRWLSPLRIHILPRLGKRRAAHLHQGDIADALRPIWRSKHDTAQKCAQRLRIVFEFGSRAGIGGVDPITVERAVHVLGHVARQVTPIPAVDWRDIPTLWRELVDHPTMAHFALRWLILTGVRQAAGRAARFDEIRGDVWTVPADRVKATAARAADFRVPLSPAALHLLDEVRPFSDVGFLFPGNTRSGGRGPITDTATQKALRALGYSAAPHGFRTSLRTWVQDTEAASYDVAEMALGHAVGSRVERSYARSDLLDARRVLMARWADFVTGAETAGNVVKLRV